MNDLSGLDWNSKSSAQGALRTSSQQAPLKSTPSPGQSRQSTPVTGPGSANGPRQGPGAGPVSSKGLNTDSFSSLLAPQPGKPAPSSLSLEERQRLLNAQKAQGQIAPDPFASTDAQFWEGLGSGRGTPAPGEQKTDPQTDEDDILSAFNSAAPVDKSSHYPPPPRRDLVSPKPTIPRGPSPLSGSANNEQSAKLDNGFADDDDPFGLGQMEQKRPGGTPQAAQDDEDDILGELGKPIEETIAARRREEIARKEASALKAPKGDSSTDKSLAELMDMGFDVGKARQALSQTPSGDDVQGAIGILLNEAHKESGGGGRSTSQARAAALNSRSTGNGRRRSSGKADRETPQWARNGHNHESSRTRAPNEDDKELSQMASEIGASVWKSANTFWKAGQKRMAKAVAEFQQDSDPNQPKWMRDTALQEERAKAPQPPSRSTASAANRTTEAELLDVGQTNAKNRGGADVREQAAVPRRIQRSTDPRIADSAPQSRSAPPAERSVLRATARPVDRLSRKAVEEESAQAYISPARRKKPQAPAQAQALPKPVPQAGPAEALDIFSDAPAPVAPKATYTASSTQSDRPVRKATPAQPRPAAPSRQTPQVSSSVLASSRSHRNAGGVAFKQGDYATAHSSYSLALNGMPSNHPVMIVLYSNRALTSLKTGDAKGAIADADAAIAIIGPSNGDNESIDMGDEGQKPMRDFFGKALMRKAEALEHLERWNEAAQIWREAVQSGIGGALSISGRNRCEKAAAPTSSSATAAPVKKKAPPRAKPATRPSTLAELNGTADGAAVKRLREQTAAAAAASDEAFALTDAVDAKLTAWKSGKADNLRGLLASLDTVLWTGSGWTKVGMGDLVLPNKVKIVYMKAIAKVHPDKLSQAATTEQKMISASVFATLNEAWDKFKKDNGM